MATYSLEKTLQLWKQEELTAEQAIGQLLQQMAALEQRMQQVEKRLRAVEGRVRRNRQLFLEGLPAPPPSLANPAGADKSL